MTELKDKIENALNEARILILGGQVLIGFNYRAFFESGFERLSPISQDLLFIALTGMLMGFGILVAPAPYHRIVEKGRISERLHGFTTRAADIGEASTARDQARQGFFFFFRISSLQQGSTLFSTTEVT